ncbi:MAG: EAL domain-containing response regulator [Gammaproteobacteria bacterium]|nr:EAL domain-containing response regulator [Gammaproteobacteria bacterium]MBU2059307.1 EAL domain-containing response regulator [Gammaproteobacteria bacterium]MBU2175313.1 EAL domain-containing response regulator [Gammaproteobacteria bacterium]MBU2247521.1 EAL domain-containing response regulator [Gammaproteobacteria bacterium]MBU2342719.1 EAL domain-containing response regulator [Gammaproteobacteria bacterium]
MQVTSALIVEDCKSYSQYLYNLCAQLGLDRIEQAENGKAALESLQHYSAYDVLICDLEMPECDGIELIHQLSRDKINAGLIIVSGKEPLLISAVENMARAGGLKVLGSLKKPFHSGKLAAMLSSAHTAVPANTCKKWQDLAPLYSLQRVKEALELHQLVQSYQPKIDMATGQLLSVETLARLQLSPNQQISPDHFIPQCEEFHLIEQLSFDMIKQAAEQQKLWQQAGLTVKVAINLSASSLSCDLFASQLLQLIRESQIKPEQLIFEVTESAVIRDTGKALSLLARLRLMGAGLSIDDYGTGYSSVKQLSQIPFTELKMDRSLISGIARTPQLQVIFESTLSMCQRLGIKVVAEGIETQADWDYLVAAGCDTAQGFFIAPAMSAEQLYQWWLNGMPMGNGPDPAKGTHVYV